MKKLQNVSSANVARGGLEAADDSQLEDGDDVFGVGGESHPSRKPTEPSSKRGKKEVEAELRSALEDFTASKERAAKEAAAAARLKEAHPGAPTPSAEPHILYPRQSAASPARGKATNKKMRSLGPKAGQRRPVGTARMEQTEADSWRVALAQFQAMAGALTPATLAPPPLTLILYIPIPSSGKRMDVCGNGSCWFYSIMAAFGVLEHAHNGAGVPTEDDFSVSQWWLSQLKVCML